MEVGHPTGPVLGRLMKEIRRRTRVVEAFPDEHSAVMLAAARLRHVAGTEWGDRAHLNVVQPRDWAVAETVGA